MQMSCQVEKYAKNLARYLIFKRIYMQVRNGLTQSTEIWTAV